LPSLENQSEVSLKEYGVQVWWLTSVILATQEVEIMRIVLQEQPQRKVPNTHLNQWLGVVAHTCHRSARRIMVQTSLGVDARPYLKNN
jgi:hypothetical protein